MSCHQSGDPTAQFYLRQHAFDGGWVPTTFVNGRQTLLDAAMLPILLTLLASSGLAGLPKVSWGLGFWLLLMAVGWMLSLGLARLGAFRADPWVAACVLLISTLILLFVVYPVGLSLQAAWLDEQGAASWSAG